MIYDPADAELVERYTWHVDSMGYAAGWVNGRLERMHRLIMGCEPGDGKVVDHINRDRLDNRRANLRPGTQQQNMQNIGAHGDAKSPYRGVSYSRSNAGWIAQRMVAGQRHHLGTYDTPEEARNALMERFG